MFDTLFTIGQAASALLLLYGGFLVLMPLHLHKEPVMQNLYLVRTATVVSLAAVLLGVGWMGMQGDDMQIAPEAVAVSSARAEPGMHFPAGFALQASGHEPEAYEYY